MTEISLRDPTLGWQDETRINYPPVLQALTERDPALGGHTLLATGKTGSGKTSWLLHHWRRLREYNGNNEKFFWRGMNLVQWTKIPDWEQDKVKLFAEDGLTLEFWDQTGPIEDQPEIEYFSSFQKLWDKADTGDFNVIYLPEATDFMDFLDWLVNEPRKGWATLMLDEVEDVAPDDAGGELWGKVGKFKDALKQCRKSLTSCYGATQTISEFHWKARRKIGYFLLCPGSPAVSETRVWQRSIDALEDHQIKNIEVGQAWLAAKNSNFNKISFPGYPTERKLKVKGL